jgi:hypothetical protein
MFVEKSLTPDPVTVAAEENISAVAPEMNWRKLRQFLVCEPNRSSIARSRDAKCPSPIQRFQLPVVNQ